jgi:hypothetical protein
MGVNRRALLSNSGMCFIVLLLTGQPEVSGRRPEIAFRGGRLRSGMEIDLDHLPKFTSCAMILRHSDLFLFSCETGWPILFNATKTAADASSVAFAGV